MTNLVDHHRGVLPHHQEAGQIISLNWRLSFSLPQHLQDIIAEMKELGNSYKDERKQESARQIFQKNYAIKMQLLDEHLGKCQTNDINLCNAQLAKIVTQSLSYYDGSLYLLHAYCLMPNHLHLLIQPLPKGEAMYHKISDCVQKLKSFTSKEINHLLDRTGALWQHEYYDRFIRDDADYARTVMYYLNNPVKAGLVKYQKDWPYSYFKNGMA